MTDLLRVGTNCLGATLGDGWYRGRLGFEGKRALYGDWLAWLAQLELVHDDGTMERARTPPALAPPTCRWRGSTPRWSTAQLCRSSFCRDAPGHAGPRTSSTGLTRFWSAALS
ncbi:alpha-L-rhamnosidase N-terminal domain-containing protein [Nonomuraea bangladeshensis]|uniref:alpha-L-rhamnosidase N-terminal domain-containing protein n=1 Tax=Nonomuraea bangladeshensis TaxID=404385 RepID=UPI0031CE5855